MTDLQAAVGSLIRAAGSQGKLARRVGVRHGYVSKLLSGRVGASPDMCRRLGIPERLATHDRSSAGRIGWRAGAHARAERARIREELPGGPDPPLTETERERIDAEVAAEGQARQLLIQRSRPLRTPKPPTVGELVRDVLRAERRLRAWAAGWAARAGEVAGDC